MFARALLAPILERPLPQGWRLLGWDSEQGICLTFQSRTCTLLFELEGRDEARDCYARTARFNVCVRHVFSGAGDLDGEERRFVDAIVDLVRRRENALPMVDRAEADRSSVVREIEVERALVPEAPGQYYFNPYVGCMIGCPYCYVQERADFSRRLEGLPRLAWGRYVDVKTNAADVLAREVRNQPPGVVRMCPILTDPYQPLERRYRVTRRALEVFLEAGFTPVILTRAARIVEDLDLLRKFPAAAVGLSIPTDDDRVREAFEPGADSIAERTEALRACHAAGLRTFVVIQPMLPMTPDDLVDTLAPLVQVARVDRMHDAERHRPLYERAGMLPALEPSFFEATGAALREGFVRRGVTLDEMDDLGVLLGGPRTA